jgi:glycosyltransferase involved in cell wall biosynthesis
VSICVPTKNSGWSLPTVLKSIETLDYPRDRVKLIFVDDRSEDDTSQILHEWTAQHKDDFYDLQFLVEPTNIPKARNLCIRHAEGEYLLFWDSDVVAYSADSLRQLLKILTANPDVGAIGCSYVYERSKAGRNFLPSPISRYTHAVYLGFTLIRKDIVDAIGHFNEGLDVGEDTEFFIRMREKTRYKVMWAPQPCLHLRSRRRYDVGGPTMARRNLLSRRWLTYNFRTRADQYARQFQHLPRFLKLRLAYYALLPPLTLLAAYLATLYLGFLALLVLYLSPAAIFECRARGVRRGLFYLFTINIPTGIALAYGVLSIVLRDPLRQEPRP